MDNTSPVSQSNPSSAPPLKRTPPQRRAECEWCGCVVPCAWLTEVEQLNHLPARVCPRCADDAHSAHERVASFVALMASDEFYG
jgi:hypothetical protein